MSLKLFIVATPIGNLSDISSRAIESLNKSSYIICENIRHTQRLLNHLMIKDKKLFSIHQHNEKKDAKKLLEQIISSDVCSTYVSDAGTPCISDPGMYLVNLARKLQIPIFAIPGPCAAVAAFSISGIQEGRFKFYGFVPQKKSAKEDALKQIKNDQIPAIIYESPKRILSLLKSICDLVGDETKVFISRELTKLYETSYSDNALNLLNFFGDNPMHQKGEFVVIINPSNIDDNESITPNEENIMKLLLQDLPLKKAANIASKIYVKKKKIFYDLGLKLKNEK